MSMQFRLWLLLICSSQFCLHGIMTSLCGWWRRWLARTRPMDRFQKHCNLPVNLDGGVRFHSNWRSCCQKGKFTWSGSATFLAFPLRAPNHTLCDEYQLVKLSMWPFKEQRGPEGQVGKVWQSNAVLLTGNIRQWRPLQINVQQVSRLAGRSLLDE